MIISFKHKFIFVKTRKTASSTIEAILFPLLGPEDICTGSIRDGIPAKNIEISTQGHRTISEIVFEYSLNQNEFYSFAIERNPFDKVLSSYYWHKKIKPHIFGAMTFEEYILNSSLLPVDWSMYAHPLNAGEKDAMASSEKFRSLVDVTEVFHYESLSRVLEQCSKLTRTKIPPSSLDRVKLKSGIRPSGTSYRDLHTPNTIGRIRSLFYYELHAFNYEF